MGMDVIKDVRWRNLKRLRDGYPTIRSFCRAAKLHESYYTQVKSGRKALGHRLSRRLESEFGLEVGWFDSSHEPEVTGTSPPRSVPEALEEFCSLTEQLAAQGRALVAIMREG